MAARRIKRLVIAAAFGGLALASAGQASAEPLPNIVVKGDDWNTFQVMGGPGARITMSGEYKPSALVPVIRPPAVVARPQTTAG